MLGFILPIICVICYALFPRPVFLILISGSMQALMLPIVGFAVLYFRYKLSDSRLGYSKIWDFFSLGIFFKLHCHRYVSTIYKNLLAENMNTHDILPRSTNLKSNLFALFITILALLGFLSLQSKTNLSGKNNSLEFSQAANRNHLGHKTH